MNSQIPANIDSALFDLARVSCEELAPLAPLPPAKRNAKRAWKEKARQARLAQARQARLPKYAKRDVKGANKRAWATFHAIHACPELKGKLSALRVRDSIFA